jgi:hypothetical protein
VPGLKEAKSSNILDDGYVFAANKFYLIFETILGLA